MEEHYKRLEKDKSYEFIIYLKDTLEPIGDIGFDRYNEELNSLEISCYIHPNYWGNGYVKEALISAMEYIYSLGFDNIIYGYYEGNIKSKRNCEKLGFKPYEHIKVRNFLGNESIEYRNIMSKEKYNVLYKKRSKKI
jgi:RimJ/RimL family protein N-acetyltransferase